MKKRTRNVITQDLTPSLMTPSLKKNRGTSPITIALIFWLSALLLTTFQSSAFGSGSNGDADEWVAGIFPKINNCTPKDWSGPISPTSALLKKKGYKPREVDEFRVKYSIREKFYGFSAVEIGIPADTDSIYTVTVKVSAKELADKIHRITGQKIRIHQNGKIAESGKAYLVPEGKNQSMFVCFTYEE